VDQIYSINVLEHIEDDFSILKEFHRVLGDSGKLYLYLPAFPILYSRFDKKIGHFRRYKKDDLLKNLEEAGFQVKNICYRDSMGFFVALIFKILTRSDTVSKKSVAIYDKLIFPFSKLFDPILGMFFGKNIEAIAVKK
jgi:predicted SAM-dependent methyltransferase